MPRVPERLVPEGGVNRKSRIAARIACPVTERWDDLRSGGAPRPKPKRATRKPRGIKGLILAMQRLDEQEDAACDDTAEGYDADDLPEGIAIYLGLEEAA